MTTALQTLQLEMNQVPALIEAAMKSRDVSTARKLKTRLAELPDLIESARIGDLESRLAALKEKDKNLSTAHQKAIATADKALAAYETAYNAYNAAVEARQVALSALISNEAARLDLEQELRVSVKMQEAAMSDKPVLLRENELGEWNRVLRRRAAASLEMV